VIVAASPAASQVVPGILGFLVVAGMALALFFLLRSMNKQLNKVAREPRWREEAKQAQQDEAKQAQPDEAEQDYTQNGTPRPG
jgi:hypothetical protein